MHIHSIAGSSSSERHRGCVTREVTFVKHLVGVCAVVGCWVAMTGVNPMSERVVAQERIEPGPRTTEPERASAPTRNEPTTNSFFQNDPPSTNTPGSESLIPGGINDSLRSVQDPLEEYRRSLEEHALRQERAKAEARARFESRSLDLIPKLVPTQSTREEEDEAAAAQFDRDVELLPPPRLETVGERANDLLADDLLTNDEGVNGVGSHEDKPSENIPSPSDLPGTRRQDPGDQLPPTLPPIRERLNEPQRKIPEPLDRPIDLPTQRPSRLGADPTSMPRLPAKSPADKSSADKDATTDTADEIEGEGNDVDQSGSSNRDDSQARSVLDSPVDPRYPNAREWTGLIEDERGRWPMPATHRPYMPVSQVMCSSCGGCVDRHGVGVCDKVGVSIGIGTREKPACQCWRCPQAAPFNLYGPGGYAGPARSAPLPDYRLRAGDQIQLTFLIKTVRTVGSYRLVVGDELLIESDADDNLTRGTLDRGLEIQPDGTLTLRFIGQVHAAGQTIEQLRELLNDRYEVYYPDPAIDVTPVRTGNVARQIREAISGSEGFNPQQTLQTVTPEGTLRLPRLGAIPTQGLTLGELKREINLRYDSLGAGLEVEVTLEQQAPHYVYVLGEVTTPGRFEMDAPTTVLGAMSLAGSYVPGANLRQVVIFRRGPNWELLSTMLDLRGALLAKASRPPDEIWVQDGDVIIVPPAPIRLFDRFVQQVFTEGIYGIVPFGGVSFSLGDNR